MALLAPAKQVYLYIMYPVLNFPAYNFRFRETAGRREVFDAVRRKFVALTPEEWVRQHVIRFLADDRKYPLSLIHVEGGLELNNLKKRFDALVYNNLGKPVMLVECKAPSVKISQAVFDQASRYNLAFSVEYLLVSNGMEHFCCHIDFEKQNITFLDSIPLYTAVPPTPVQL